MVGKADLGGMAPWDQLQRSSKPHPCRGKKKVCCGEVGYLGPRKGGFISYGKEGSEEISEKTPLFRSDLFPFSPERVRILFPLNIKEN